MESQPMVTQLPRSHDTYATGTMPCSPPCCPFRRQGAGVLATLAALVLHPYLSTCFMLVPSEPRPCHAVGRRFSARAPSAGCYDLSSSGGVVVAIVHGPRVTKV